ncbi:serine hydrolase domain-containing protein [Lelliottia amnigena]|uniref:serine hydrolase domain-containing protein n=1 Tax=Lelliottia amnigena TaxID=61646 RepID=UPI0040578E3D
MKFLIPLLLSPLLALTGCTNSTLSQMDNPDQNITPVTVGYYGRNIDPMINQYMQEKQVTGMVVAIIYHNGSAEFHSYGVTDDLSQRAITPDTLFALGSLSKGVTAEVATLLVNEGQLNWTDTLETLLPRGTSLSADAKKITLLQLVTHTSGLPRQPMDLLTLENLLSYFRTGENFYAQLDNDSLLTYLSDFDAPAYRVPQYSNIGYALLSHILQRRTGKSMETLAQDKLLKPLQMSNSSFTPESLKAYPYRALGHAGDQPKFISRGALTPDWVFQQNMMGAASLYSSARDLAEYARAHFTATSHPAIDRALADVTQTYFYRQKEAANIAWVSDETASQKITYQVGYIGGYSSYIGFDKKNQSAVIVLQNSFNWSNYIGQTILTLLEPQKSQILQEGTLAMTNRSL